MSVFEQIERDLSAPLLSDNELSKRRTKARENKYKVRRLNAALALGSSLLVLAGATGGSDIVRAVDGPNCTGSQKVTAQPGDTISTIKQRSIESSDGSFVDLSSVAYSVDRPTQDEGMQWLGQTTNILIGDVVSLPDSCKA